MSHFHVRKLLIMSTARRSSCFLSVLLLVLINGVPSLAQNETTTVEPSSSNTTTSSDPLSSTSVPPITTSSAPPSTPAPPTVLSMEAIIGIAVGGGALLICVAMLSLCLCICCSRRKRGRNKNFNPSTTEKKSSEGDSPTYRTLTPPQDLDQREGNNNEFEMQVNVAHFTEDVSSDRNLKPGELFGMKKSASSSQIHETRFNSEGNQATTNADTQSSGQPPELKGYIKMSSAGSVRPSRSVGDISGLEQDVGIYVEPDRTGAEILVQAESYRDPPKLHPKTASMSAVIATGNVSATNRHEAVLSTTEEEVEGGVYEAPDIFRIDRQTQEEIDSYYNKDTIESIRQGRGLTNVVDPSDAIYTNVNSSSSTPSHQANKISDSHTGRREEGASASVATSSSGAAAVVKGAEEEAEHDSGEEGYYNVRRHTSDSDVEDNYDYYNSVQGVGSNQPLLDPDDDQYVYIEKSDIARSVPSAVAMATGKPTVAAKPRHLTSPAPQPRKYVNLGPNQRQVLQEKTKGKADPPVSATPEHQTTHASMTNGATVGGASDIDESADQPLYANLMEEDEGGKEIYANIL